MGTEAINPARVNGKNFAFALVLVLAACGASNEVSVSQEEKSGDQGKIGINSSLVSCPGNS